VKRYSGYSKISDTFTGDYGTIPDVHVNYRLIGEWTRANYMMRMFPVKVTQAVNLATREMAYKYRKEVINNINNQGANLGWQISRSEKYQEFKERYSNRTVADHYRFFDAMLSNIKTYKKGVMGWSTGIKEGVQNIRMSILRKGRTLTIAEYAGVLEHGSIHIPARPLWLPSYRNIGGNPELTRLVALHIRLKFPSTRLRLPRSPGAARALSSM